MRDMKGKILKRCMTCEKEMRAENGRLTRQVDNAAKMSTDLIVDNQRLARERGEAIILLRKAYDAHGRMVPTDQDAEQKLCVVMDKINKFLKGKP